MSPPTITTAGELLALPRDGVRYELVDGRLRRRGDALTPAGPMHGAVTARVTHHLFGFVDAHGAGDVLAGDIGFVLRENPDTVRAPDVAFVRAGRIASGYDAGFFRGAPDLAVEVVSPRDSWPDVQAKALQWIDAGATFVWVVDPQTTSVTVFDRRRRARVFVAGDELDGGDLLPGFRVRVARLFP